MVRVSQYIRNDEERGEGFSAERARRVQNDREGEGSGGWAKGIGSGGWRLGVDGEGGRTGERRVVRSRGSGANICLPPGKLKAHREERE